MPESTPPPPAYNYPPGVVPPGTNPGGTQVGAAGATAGGASAGGGSPQTAGAAFVDNLNRIHSVM